MSEEEKEAIYKLIEIREFANLSSYKDIKIKQLNAIDVILNLIEKQSKELEDLKDIQQQICNEELFTKEYVDKLRKEIEELKKENLEIREWKYVIDTIEDLDKLKELDLIKIKGKKFINEDKIKAKIEEYKKMEKATYGDLTFYGDYRRDVIQEVLRELQSLLEKE